MSENTDTALYSVLRTIQRQHGFLTDTEVAALAGRDSTRLTQVLVRCGGSRFTCAAQDAARLIAAVEASGDYVRDVCLPAGSPLYTDGEDTVCFVAAKLTQDVWGDFTEAGECPCRECASLRADLQN